MRLKSYPFTKAVEQFIDRHTRVYVIEQNRDAQMLSLLKLDLMPNQIGKLRSVLYYAGLPIDARTISDEVLAQESETVKG
jgi:2-oxoglutarate ferredoxin oxidoreductase subunit alpha